MAITISFQCENHNHVLLLTALYDLLTVESVEDSIAAQDYTDWLLDEIVHHLEEVDEFDGGGRLEQFARQVLEIHRARLARVPPEIP